MYCDETKERLELLYKNVVNEYNLSADTHNKLLNEVEDKICKNNFDLKSHCMNIIFLDSKIACLEAQMRRIQVAYAEIMKTPSEPKVKSKFELIKGGKND